MKTFDKGLETADARRKALVRFLNPTDKKIPPITDNVKQDLSFCSYLTSDCDDYLLSHPEFLRFQKSEHGSLVVHGVEHQHNPESTSTLSAFFWKSSKILSEKSVVLSHSVGLSSAGKNYPSEHLKGSSDVLRSLSAQVLAREDLVEDLTLSWLNNKRLADAATKKHARFHLAMFFRGLILDIAEFPAANGECKSIRVIVDGVDRLENGNTLSDILAIFRGIADEIELGPLNKNLKFKYLLLHPQVSRMAIELNPNERHIFVKSGLDPRDEVEEAPTSRKKGKGKAKKGKVVESNLKSEVGNEVEDDEDDYFTSIRKHEELLAHLVRTELIVKPEREEYYAELRENHEKFIKKLEGMKRQVEEWLGGSDVPHIPYIVGRESPAKKQRLLAIAIWYPKIQPLSPKKHSSANLRRENLSNALYGPGLPPPIAGGKHYDRQNVEQQMKQHADFSTARLVTEHPEFVRFLKDQSCGLIIHGGEPYQDSYNFPFTRFAGLLTTQFTAKPNVISLTYAAGLDVLHDPKRKAKMGKTITGTTGLLRQLCFQFVHHTTFKENGLRLSFLEDLEYLAPVRLGGPAVLLPMFRRLLLELADWVSSHGLKRQTVEVLIDSVNWDELDEEYENTIFFFRTITDEFRITEVGKYVRFKYLIMHPHFSKFASSPGIHERHLFWGKGFGVLRESLIRQEESGTVFSESRNQEDIDHFVDVLSFAWSNNDIQESQVFEWLSRRNERLEWLRDNVNAGHFPEVSLPVYSNGVQPKIWSSSGKQLILFNNKRLDSAGHRRQALQTALNSDLGGISRVELARQDRQVCGEHYTFDVEVRALLEDIALHDTIMRFWKGEIHGVVVHNDLIPGQKIPFAGENTERALAAFINLYYIDETRRDSIVLTHVMSTYAAKLGLTERRDAEGTTRSLCCQLLESVFDKYKKPLQLEFLDDETLGQVQKCELNIICRLFRDLLCELATYLAKAGKPKQRIVAIIDCTQFEESEDIRIGDLVDTMRSIIDETEACELGKHIDFNYILFRPANEHVTVSPIDRHIFLDDVVLSENVWTGEGSSNDEGDITDIADD